MNNPKTTDAPNTGQADLSSTLLADLRDVLQRHCDETGLAVEDLSITWYSRVGTGPRILEIRVGSRWSLG